MRERTIDGITFLTFDRFDADARVSCLVTTRAGGESAPPYDSLNLGPRCGDDAEAVARNHARVAGLVGAEALTTGNQVHDCRVAVVGSADAGRRFEDTDALVSAEAEVALAVLVADCAAVMLYDPEAGAVGVAHAGWRGTLAGAAARTAAAMAMTLGAAPGRMIAAIGPCIGPCCYEVGPEVAAAFRASHAVIADEILAVGPRGREMLDLWRANRLQLVAAGVPEAHVEVARACTACETGRFFSHRAESGKTGRFAAVIARNARAPRRW
jgi:YfiH family protein